MRDRSASVNSAMTPTDRRGPDAARPSGPGEDVGGARGAGARLAPSGRDTATTPSPSAGTNPNPSASSRHTRDVPLGASGARIMTTMVNALEQRGGRYALQTMCEGGGMANATIIERLD